MSVVPRSALKTSILQLRDHGALQIDTPNKLAPSGPSICGRSLDSHPILATQIRQILVDEVVSLDLSIYAQPVVTELFRDRPDRRLRIQYVLDPALLA